MKEIYILGAGGFAKEIYFLITQIGGYVVKAFIDLKTSPDTMMPIGKTSIPVLGEEQLDDLKDICLAIGVGDPRLNKKITNRFGHRFEFPNLIHPAAIGDFSNIAMGQGNIICAGCNLTTEIELGSFNILNLSVIVGHDVVIGSNNVINPCACISGGVQIGDCNLIGVHATILQYKHIGNNSVVGAASLVMNNVGDGITVAGNPALKF